MKRQIIQSILAFFRLPFFEQLLQLYALLFLPAVTFVMIRAFSALINAWLATRLKDSTTEQFYVLSGSLGSLGAGIAAIFAAGLAYVAVNRQTARTIAIADREFIVKHEKELTEFKKDFVSITRKTLITMRAINSATWSPRKQKTALRSIEFVKGKLTPTARALLSVIDVDVYPWIKTIVRLIEIRSELPMGLKNFTSTNWKQYLRNASPEERDRCIALRNELYKLTMKFETDPTVIIGQLNSYEERIFAKLVIK